MLKVIELMAIVSSSSYFLDWAVAMPDIRLHFSRIQKSISAELSTAHHKEL